MIPNKDEMTRGLDGVVVRKSVHTYVNPEDAREVREVTKKFSALPEQSKDAPVILGGEGYAERDVREAHTEAAEVPKLAPVEEVENDEAEDEVPEGNVNEVNEWVDGDPDRARRALDAENARSKPRKSLLEDLNNVIGE